MTDPSPPPLAFDDVVIDFAGRRLIRGGAEQPLEPKAFSVLALLAGSPGRAFTRDEILDAVWTHRHVTPGVLNRVVALLRQALGEDAQHPRLLHTVHATGYRFDLPADADSEAGDPGAAMAAAPGTSAVTAATPGRSRRRPRALPLALLAFLAMLAAAAWWSWWPRAGDGTDIADAAPVTLVVMPLKPIGEGGGEDVLADGLGEELIGTLARIDRLRVIARTSASLAAAESTDPQRLIERLGITHLLEGSLQRDGQRLRIRLRLVDAKGGNALWTRNFDRDAAEVLLLQREIAEAVAGSLALRLGLPEAWTRTGDAEFLRRSLAAWTLIDRFGEPVEDSAERAEGEFRALLRERPDDARARAGLAWALEMRAQQRTPLAPMLREESLREAALARQLDPEVPDAYVLQGLASCRGDDWDGCVGMFTKVRELAPSHPAVGFYCAAMARLGYLDRAEDSRREIVARDPANVYQHYWYGRLLDTMGRHDEALAELSHLGIESANARWYNAAWRGDFAEALRIAETEIGDPRNPDAEAPRLAPGYIATSKALLDPRLWPEAEAEYARLDHDGEVTAFFRIFAPDAPRHAARLIADFHEARLRGHGGWDLLLWTRDLAWLRRDPAFQDYLRDTGILAYWRRHGFPSQCRPDGEGAACD